MRIPFLDTIIPRACKICGCRLAVGEEELCGVCNLHLPRTHFYQDPEDNELARLFWGLIPIQKACALFYYQPHHESSRAIHNLKYYDSPHLGQILGQMIAQECTMAPRTQKQSKALKYQDPSGRNYAPETSGEKLEPKFEAEREASMKPAREAGMEPAREAGMGAEKGPGAGFFDGIDIIIPIPLTRKREWNRGYNQSEEIAKGISRYTKIPIVTNAVKRTRFAQSQTRLKSEQRKQNVENAFKLLKPSLIKGKHILLVDDIITTGATVYSCAKELQKAGNTTFSIISVGFTKK